MVKSCPDAELPHGGSATEGGSRMANRQSWGTRLLLAIALLSAGIGLAGEARAQAVVDEAWQAGQTVGRGARRLLHNSRDSYKVGT